MGKAKGPTGGLENNDEGGKRRGVRRLTEPGLPALAGQSGSGSSPNFSSLSGGGILCIAPAGPRTRILIARARHGMLPSCSGALPLLRLSLVVFVVVFVNDPSRHSLVSRSCTGSHSGRNTCSRPPHADVLSDASLQVRVAVIPRHQGKDDGC